MGVNKEITMVNTANLTSKADFQRQINTSRVAKIAKEWDEKKMKPIQVADIDGTFYIWDGQHTAAAALLNNANVDLEIPCIVDKMSYQEVCECVAQQDKYKTKHTAFHQFNTSVLAGDATDTHIKAILDKYRIKIDTSCGENKTSAVSALRSIYKDSPLFLDEVLNIATKAWPGQIERYKGEVLTALGKIVKVHNAKFKTDEMVGKIGVYSLSSYMSTAKEMAGSKVESLTMLFITNYNKGKSVRKLSISDVLGK